MLYDVWSKQKDNIGQCDIPVFTMSAMSGHGVDTAFKYMIFEIIQPYIDHVRDKLR